MKEPVSIPSLWTVIFQFLLILDVSHSYVLCTEASNLSHHPACINPTHPIRVLQQLGSVDLVINISNLGTIPDDFPVEWTYSTVFDVGTRQISGTIPSSMSTWTSLLEFYVNSTQISGTIPSSLSSWTSLQRFDVSSTQISGTIPSSLSTWTTLQWFYIGSTQISGIVPFSSTLLLFEAVRSNISGCIYMKNDDCPYRSWDFSYTGISCLNLTCMNVKLICQYCLNLVHILPDVLTYDCTASSFPQLPKFIPKAIQTLTM
eukprot:PhF_6_TR15802/c0_g1_i1/m.24452